MISTGTFLGIVSLCVTFYSLGYVRGKHDSKTEK